MFLCQYSVCIYKYIHNACVYLYAHCTFDIYIYIIDYNLFYGKCGKHNNKPIWDDRYKP